MKNNISACLIIRNEAGLLGRCLKSLAGAVDEIILIHDGKCVDQSLEIASQYKAKIFERPERGYMEAHLPFALREAGGEWILRIDADEYLSQELAANLRKLTAAEVCAYSFFWPLWDGTREVSSCWPVKTCFFKKNAVSFIALPHALIRVAGKTALSGFTLYHRPDYDNLSIAVFKSKWLKWARTQARIYFKDFSAVEKFNCDEKSWPLKIRLRKKLPLALLPLEFFWTFADNLASGALKAGQAGLKTAFFRGLYRATVNYRVYAEKRLLKKYLLNKTSC
ncbi:MAG: glycosyltransferase [Patescibacteria group bacterium]|jgi:glycosyltransferase involved in cell wall biosynthesis